MNQGIAITWLGERECHDARLSGGKASALSRLAEWHRVPPGFCITSRALSGVTPPMGIPEHLRDAVVDAYAALSGDVPAVAVRSSAVDEDGALTSFAGVHESYLNVRGHDAVLAAVDRCVESFFGERALAYRREHGMVAVPRAAVLVQQQVVSDVSIVAFSANPINRALDEIVVTASWGLGESVVGGSVTPDTWILRREGQILDERIGDKRRMTVAIEGGSREVDVPRVLREVASLQQEQLIEVAALATALEQQTGGPVDIECAYAGGRLYLLQCRPITTLSSATDRAGPVASPGPGSFQPV
jgi:pyruvate, water dikinase